MIVFKTVFLGVLIASGATAFAQNVRGNLPQNYSFDELLVMAEAANKSPKFKTSESNASVSSYLGVCVGVENKDRSVHGVLLTEMEWVQGKEDPLHTLAFTLFDHSEEFLERDYQGVLNVIRRESRNHYEGPRREGDVLMNLAKEFEGPLNKVVPPVDYQKSSWEQVISANDEGTIFGIEVAKTPMSLSLEGISQEKANSYEEVGRLKRDLQLGQNLYQVYPGEVISVCMFDKYVEL